MQWRILGVRVVWSREEVICVRVRAMELAEKHREVDESRVAVFAWVTQRMGLQGCRLMEIRSLSTTTLNHAINAS
jgi:hypothetical protein